jgi:glucan phosphoethanolaminetransferase (alkaline phosphatase superfamily)
MEGTSRAPNWLRRDLPVGLLSAVLILCLPFAVLSVWLLRVKGLQSLAAFTVSIVLLLVLAAMVTRTWRVFLLSQFPILLLSTAFTMYVIAYNTPPGEFIAYALATSSWEEIRGFFSIWQGLRLLLVMATIAAVYLVLAARAPRRPIFSGSHARGRWGFLAVVVVLSAYAARSPGAFVDGLAANPGIGMALFIAGPMAHARAAVNGSAVRKVRYDAARTDTEEVHVLVIGESARRDSWSVYGYHRDTTPYLEKLRGEAIFLQHAVADANFTVCVVPILLTGMNPGHFDMGSIRGNLVDLAEEAGYSTAWLMNQDPHISLLIGIHADRMVYPPAISTLMAGHLPLDESLLPALRREIDRRGVSRFIGLHIIGSHWEYDTRYPASFERFGSGKGLSYLSALTQKLDPRVLDAYDNSLAYTDWFLGQVIEQVRTLSVPATVTYIADHGEDLYALDGNTGHGTATYTRHQFDIPAFVWVNAAYRSTHPDKVQAIAQNADKEIRSHNIFNSMADLMGIRWPGASPSESFASTQFVPDLKSPHIAGGTLVSGMD